MIICDTRKLESFSLGGTAMTTESSVAIMPITFPLELRVFANAMRMDETRVKSRRSVGNNDRNNDRSLF